MIRFSPENVDDLKRILDESVRGDWTREGTVGTINRYMDEAGINPPVDPFHEVGAVGRPAAHYQSKSGLDAFTIIDEFGLDFYEGSAVKYLLRWKRKGGTADLDKAKHYIDEIKVRAAEIQAKALQPKETNNGTPERTGTEGVPKLDQ